MKRLILLLVAISACKWTDFDDLADKTWAHAADKPNIGSSDYAIAIAGATNGTTGGRLAVISNDAPNYSTLDFDASGASSLGANPQKLGLHFISSVSAQPIFISDGTGKIALVERAIDQGQVAVVSGPADSPADMPFASTGSPDAAAFLGARLEVTTAAPSGSPNAFILDTTNPLKSCELRDDLGNALTSAALVSDGITLWAWTKSGGVFGYTITVLDNCTMAGGPVSPSTAVFKTKDGAADFLPGTGAKAFVLGTNLVLAAHGDKSTAGRIFVVDMTTVTQVGSTVSADGLRTTDIATLKDGKTYLVIGMPSAAVDGVTAGKVELHEIAAGAVSTSTALTLSDAQPESDQQFGRAVATMKFNGDTILVVAAKSEVFAYYKTLLYDSLP